MPQPRYATERLAGVTIYESSIVHLAQHPQFESAWDIAGDIGGWDVADGFRLEEPDGSYSEWRISILDSQIIYAVLRRLPHDSYFTFDGPVWVIAEIPESLSGRGSVPSKPIVELARELEISRHQPDSLVAAIQAIHQRLARTA